MLRVLVNGLTAKTGGGRSILNNYLGLLKASTSTDKYFVLTPHKGEYDHYARENVEIIDIHTVYKRHLVFPLLYQMVMPRLLRDHHIDVVFNLGDIVIPTATPQLYLFDWSYAVYPESVVWHRLDWGGYLSRKAKLSVLRRYLKYATVVIAQSPTMKERLKALYGLERVEIVPNAVSLENLSGGSPVAFPLPQDRIRLLYLTYYYAHKNLEIFLPLAQKIKDRSLPYCLITTVGPAQHKKAAAFLREIRQRRLEDVIINIGPIPMGDVPSLYEQCDALLMPTLLESFSGTYVEAMYHRKPIFTSALDFAEDVCGDAAFYFDPLDPDSILSSLNLAFHDDELRHRHVEAGSNRLTTMPSWEQAFERYQELLQKTVSNTRPPRREVP